MLDFNIFSSYNANVMKGVDKIGKRFLEKLNGKRAKANL